MHCIATVFEGPEQTGASDMIGWGRANKTDSAELGLWVKIIISFKLQKKKIDPIVTYLFLILTFQSDQ